MGALKEKPPVAEPSEKPEDVVEPRAGREKEKPVEDAEVGGAKEAAAVTAGGGAVKDKVAGGRALPEDAGRDEKMEDGAEAVKDKVAEGMAVPEDAGKDGKTEDAAETGATEDDDDLVAGARSPSSGSGTAATVSCLTPGLRFSREKGHRTPSVDSSISVGAGGNLFSSDRCMSS